MISNQSRMLVVLLAFLAGLGVSLGLIFFITGNGPVPPPASAIGGPFQLVDQNNKPISDTDLKGKPSLVFFGYTHCPDVCPTTLFDISEVFRSLGKDADKVNALFITVDPQRDTPAVLKDYLSAFDPHLKAAAGDAAATAAVEKAFRVYAKKVPAEGGYTMDHTAIVYLMDKAGNFVSPFNLNRKPEESAAALKKYI
jgi:protein SCO1/2